MMKLIIFALFSVSIAFPNSELSSGVIEIWMGMIGTKMSVGQCCDDFLKCNLSRAYDCANHDKLLNILDSNGILGTAMILGTTFVKPNDRQPSRFRIINGQNAEANQFPYLVGLYVKTPSYTDFCGGSLISNNYVLTAAHCVDTATSVSLIFGAFNITNNAESTQVRVVSTDFIVHSGWNSTLLVNDIALIKLQSPIQETSAIKIVSLATGTDTYDNDQATVAGWGLTKITQTGITPILQYAISSIMTNTNCKKIDKDYNAVMKDTLLCLAPGSNKVGTCQGDSGGPLVSEGVQVGLVSFGANDCEAGKPSVFTRLTKYQSWIASNSDVSF